MIKAPRLIIVDDDEVYCQVLARALKRRKFEVEVAYCIAECLEKSAIFQPHYAIVDLRIGEESGLQVVEQLIQQNSVIKIVVLTGYASIATAVEAIKLGAIHYLTKPLETDEIIRPFLENSSGDSEIQIPKHPPSVKRLEWEHLQKVLSENDGNISATARSLNMHRRTLQRKLQKKPVKQ